MRTRVVAVAAVLFLLSGFSALLYQVAWQRILGIFSGMHIYSITMIVTAFMAGLGFGSYFGGRWADRQGPARAVGAFAVCELAIGLFALLSPWLYYDVAYVRLGFLVRYPALLPTVHLGLLIVPTFLMGASLPLLSRGLVARRESAARTIGILYGVNALGAALGAALSVWVLIGAFGFAGTIRIGVVLNLVAAAGAVWIARSLRRGDVEADSQAHATAAPHAPPSAQGRPFSLGTWALVYALSGFIALSLELLWFRVLDVTIKSSPYTFGHLLGVFLFCLALGSLAGSWVVHRSRRPDLTFFRGQWAITLLSGLSLVLLCRLPADVWPLSDLLPYWHDYTGLLLSDLLKAARGTSDPLAARTLVLGFEIYLLMPLLLLGLPTFLMGWTFAFIQRAVQTDLQGIGRRVGLIQTANILGSIGGSVLTGTLFLPWFGTANSFRLLIVAGSVFGVLAVLRRTDGVRPWRAAVPAAVALALALCVPAQQEFWARFHGSEARDLELAEDASSIVALQRLDGDRAVLRVNGKGHSLLPYGGVHTLLGVFPILLHPRPTEVLLIGLGAGNTAWAAASSPELERLDCYEIAEPEFTVLQRFDRSWCSSRANDQLLAAGSKLHLQFTDGRLALRTEPRLYDVIEVDALEPFMAYSGNLYSAEFFESAKERLKPGGIFLSYTPTPRTERTMVQVFPHVLHFHGPNLPSFMVGSHEPIAFDPVAIRERLQSPGFQAYFEQSEMYDKVRKNIAMFLAFGRCDRISGDARLSFADGEINTDLFPRDEYDPGLAP